MAPLKGTKPWNKGKKGLQVGYWKGLVFTEEHKQKLREAHKGQHPVTEFKKGNIPWMEGKHHTEETKEKLRIANKGQIPWCTGENLSLEHRLKTTGKNHYNWKGGITLLNKQIRQSFSYRQWRSDIFTRDDFTCQKCNKRGGTLHAHHIMPFALIMELNDIKTFEQGMICDELWNINNGITYCKECH